MSALHNRGWNYVHCIESVVWDSSFNDETDCWKLTSLCRDITNTPMLDEFGRSASSSGLSTGSLGTSPDTNSGTKLGLALASALLAGFVIFQSMRGGFKRKDGTEPYGDIQFSQVQAEVL